MVIVAYFTAVIARAGGAWRARDIEVDEALSLDELAESLRAVAADGEPVIALLEHEDEWFAVVRVDGDDEPRIFVSDLPAASRGGFAALVAPAADVVLEEEPEDDEDDGGESDDAEPSDGPAAWAGDPDLLDDLGVPGPELRRWVEDHGEDPAAVLADVGEQVGFGELLEALR